MRASIGWTLGALATVAVLIFAFSNELANDPERAADPAGRTHREADTPEALAGPRQRADLQPCPVGAGAGPEKLQSVLVECAADGSQVDVGRVVAGRAVVLNLWAYWCGPCADELPAMQDYQRRVGNSVSVITVHQDENELAGLVRMAELGVHLPVLQDGARRTAAALSVPNVMPATVVLRPDGSVATMLLQPFTSADEIAAAVEPALR